MSGTRTCQTAGSATTDSLSIAFCLVFCEAPTPLLSVIMIALVPGSHCVKQQAHVDSNVDGSTKGPHFAFWCRSCIKKKMCLYTEWKLPRYHIDVLFHLGQPRCDPSWSHQLHQLEHIIRSECYLSTKTEKAQDDVIFSSL